MGDEGWMMEDKREQMKDDEGQMDDERWRMGDVANRDSGCCLGLGLRVFQSGWLL
jgi:hypothetical protein